jgi:hypothetical protein
VQSLKVDSSREWADSDDVFEEEVSGAFQSTANLACLLSEGNNYPVVPTVGNLLNEVMLCC